ncbi:MAG: hypothetical protein ACXWXK_01380 [Actinomycetota bacterium]
MILLRRIPPSRFVQAFRVCKGGSGVTTTSTTATGRPFASQSPGRSRARRPARIAIGGVVLLDLLILLVGSLTARDTILDAGLDLLAWTAAVAVVGFAAVQTPAGPQLAIDMPVLLAAGYLLGPIPSGLIAFAGYVDLREFRGEIGWERAIFNRAQTSLSVMAAASVFAFFTGESGLWPEAALGALAAVGVDCFVNFGLVAGVMAINDRLRPRTSLSRLRLGPLLQFGLTYAAYGFVSLLLAEIYVSVGVWGVVLFATPLVLAHQALSTAQKLDGARNAYGFKGRPSTRRLIGWLKSGATSESRLRLVFMMMSCPRW